MSTEAAERRAVAWFLAVAGATAATVFIADALTKRAVVEALAVGEAREIVPGWFVLTHVRNTGTAYGLLADHGWLVLPLSIAAAIVVPLVLWRGGFWRGRPVLGGLSAGLILGGALGNLVDRIQNGAVTDFAHVPYIPLFQVFNVADASICVGAVVVLALGFFDRQEAAEPAPQGEGR
jgi:signal peptidase II